MTTNRRRFTNQVEAPTIITCTRSGSCSHCGYLTITDSTGAKIIRHDVSRYYSRNYSVYFTGNLYSKLDSTSHYDNGGIWSEDGSGFSWWEDSNKSEYHYAHCSVSYPSTKRGSVTKTNYTYSVSRSENTFTVKESSSSSNATETRNFSYCYVEWLVYLNGNLHDTRPESYSNGGGRDKAFNPNEYCGGVRVYTWYS